MEAALKLYEATRTPRTSAMQVTSGANTWLRNDSDPGWVYGYDACTAPLGTAPAGAMAS